MSEEGINKVKVEFKRLYKDSILPTKAHESDAGYDLYVHSAWVWEDDGKLHELVEYEGSFCIGANTQILFKTGFGMALPVGYEAQIRPRSGLALKHGLTVTNSPGTIDAGYRNEVGVILCKITNNTLAPSIKRGDRIAQMVIQKLPNIEIIEVNELSNPSERGQAGFGSSGK